MRVVYLFAHIVCSALPAIADTASGLEVPQVTAPNALKSEYVTVGRLFRAQTLGRDDLEDRTFPVIIEDLRVMLQFVKLMPKLAIAAIDRGPIEFRRNAYHSALRDTMVVMLTTLKNRLPLKPDHEFYVGVIGEYSSRLSEFLTAISLSLVEQAKVPVSEVAKDLKQAQLKEWLEANKNPTDVSESFTSSPFYSDDIFADLKEEIVGVYKKLYDEQHKRLEEALQGAN
ncbi:unnamed protein product [Hyaloperonospora brassicae]|uniref:RxLR effector candidate protein n=1 Tax=Hyaloperonospora brassicae TaxID=162125 RepID=A0AAV0TUZ6_HYABA|nr:unnamed protein product [Hyaloperonospora brassicae]